MYNVNTWFSNETVIHKATCPYGPDEHSPSGEGNPSNPYRLGPFGLQTAIDEAEKLSRHIHLCEHCFAAEIAEPEPRIAFETYENYPNPHVKIHRVGCGEIRKGGGTDPKRGKYVKHATYAQAEAYARTTGLPIENCMKCSPRE